MLDADDSVLGGASHEIPPFVLPVARLHSDAGSFSWFELDESGERLIQFADRFGSYD